MCVNILSISPITTAKFLTALVLWGNTTRAGTSRYKFPRFRSAKLSVLNNVSKETDTGDVEKPQEEREVTILSFMIGLIVAFLFNANLFNFFDTLHPPGLRPASPFAKSPLFGLDPAFFNVSVVFASNVRNTFNYDFTKTDLRTYSRGTHELMIGFLIGNRYGDTCPRNVW